MVNASSETDAPDRRERPRAGAEHAPALGSARLNPFGDLVTLQHLTARAARSLKSVFEGVLRRDLRSWAEPLVVQRWADYRTERGEGLSAWQPLAMSPGKAQALLVLEGRSVLEMLDAFFGGDGEAPSMLPDEFTPAAQSMVGRIGHAVADPLAAAWEPVSRIEFAPVAGAAIATAPDLGGDTAMVVTRLGFAAGDAAPFYIDLLYPVAGLKPHAPQLTAKVQAQDCAVEPEWRNGLTRAVMAVSLPVRSVLAEPQLRLGQLLELKVGDVIPIEFGPEVPVMVAARRLGTGQVGTSNGRAAVRLTSIEPISQEDLA